MSDKDYLLLRPFDLEAAKRGEAICYSHLMSVVEFVGEATAIGYIATKEEDGRIAITPRSQFRLAPLCWVEGKPVYQDDVLYYNSTNLYCGSKFVAKRAKDDLGIYGHSFLIGAANHTHESAWEEVRSLTWAPPKVKREGWVNIIQYSKHGGCGELKDRIVRNCDIFHNQESASEFAQQCGDVIACVRIEWEEQP